MQLVVILGIGGLLAAGVAAAQEPYYKGKTIRIVVGFTAGGGFDAYSRAPGASNPDNITRAARAAIGLPTQIVTGYKGTAEIRLAAESGELAGACWGWGSLRATWRKALDAREVQIVLQITPKPHADLPNVPLAINYARTDDTRRILEVAVHNDSTLVRTYTLPPGTPRDRVQILRKSFQETLRDPAFLADAEKQKLEIEPVTAEEIERAVESLFKLEPAMVAKLRTVLLE